MIQILAIIRLLLIIILLRFGTLFKTFVIII